MKEVKELEVVMIENLSKSLSLKEEKYNGS